MLAALIAAGAGELGSMAAAAELATAATTAAEMGTAATTLGTAAGAGELGVLAGGAPEVFSAAAPAAEGIASGAQAMSPEITSNLGQAAAQNAGAQTTSQGIAEGASRFAPQVPNPVDTTAPMQVNTAGQNVAPAQEGIRTTQAATAPTPTPGSPGNPVDINQGLLRGVDYEAIPGFDVPQAGAAAEKSGLEKGIDSALKFSKEHPLATTLGIQAAGALLGPSSGGGGGGAPSRKPVARKDMSGFSASEPRTAVYNPIYQPTPYANGGITSYGIGGPVEQMSAQNAIGANTGYPMANLQTPMYTNPQISRPSAANVISPSADTGVDAYTGEMRFATGGDVQDNEDYVRALAKREMASGIVSDSDVDTRNKDPMNASITALKKIGKRVGVKTTDMPKSGITDSNVFHAAEGGTTPSTGQQYYNPNNSALRAEQAQNAATPDMGIYGFLSQMFGGFGTGGVRGGTGIGPVMNGAFGNMGNDPTKQPIHYTGMAQGGIAHGLGGYSDGGRLLKGPGDGVSDSIPATIGNKQPARLADGEFVVPARIVSELGNGSTEAGARKLYEMMDRVQADRKKSIGKGKVAVNSKAAKHLPK